MYYLAVVLLLLFLAAAWVLTLFTLPGNWAMVGFVALFAVLIEEDGTIGIGWPVVIGLAVLALIGELIEMGAGALGAAQAGGSKRGMLLAVVGSMTGSVAGALLGFPIPLVGPIIGVLLGASLGALGGAMLGEWWKGRELSESWQVGHNAFWGRLVGTLGKSTVGLAMIGVAMVAAVF